MEAPTPAASPCGRAKTAVETTPLPFAGRQAVKQDTASFIANLTAAMLAAGVGGRAVASLPNLFSSQDPPRTQPRRRVLPIPVPPTDEEEKIADDASGPVEMLRDAVAGFLSTPENQPSFLAGDYATNYLGNPATWAVGLPLGAAAGYGGWKLTDALLDRQRKSRTDSDLEDAKRRYMELVGSRFGDKRAAAEQLDRLAEARVEKRASGEPGDWRGAMIGAGLGGLLGGGAGYLTSDEDDAYRNMLLGGALGAAGGGLAGHSLIGYSRPVGESERVREWRLPGYSDERIPLRGPTLPLPKDNSAPTLPLPKDNSAPTLPLPPDEMVKEVARILPRQRTRPSESVIRPPLRPPPPDPYQGFLELAKTLLEKRSAGEPDTTLNWLKRMVPAPVYDAAGGGTGLYGAYALLSALGAGSLAYPFFRKRTDRALYDEARKRREKKRGLPPSEVVPTPVA